MPRAKTTGDRYADKGRRTTRTAEPASETVRGAGMEILPAAATTERSAEAALDRLAVYDEGWIRIVSHEFGKQVFYKFKFSKGRFRNSYVFIRKDSTRTAECLWLLVGKVEGVYEGTVRPTPDQPYD